MKFLRNNNRNTLPTALASIALIASLSAMGMTVYNTREINNQNNSNNYDLGNLADINPGSAYTTPNIDPYSIGENHIRVDTSLKNEEYSKIIEKDFARINEKNNTTDKSSDTAEEDLIDNSASSTDIQVTVNELLALAPNIVLNDVSGVGALGKFSMANYSNQTILRLAAINLPELSDTEYYEAWLINGSNQDEPFSIGTLRYEASSSQATLFRTLPTDKTNHAKVLVTLEKSGPEKNISASMLENSFSPDTNFIITDSDILDYRNAPTEIMDPLSEASDPVINNVNPQNNPNILDSIAPNSAAANPLADALKSNSSIEDLIKSLKSRQSSTDPGSNSVKESLSLNLSDLFTPGEANANNSELLKNLLDKKLGG